MYRIIEDIKGVTFNGPGRSRGVFSLPRRYKRLDSALLRMRRGKVTGELKDDHNNTVAVAKQGVILGVMTG